MPNKLRRSVVSWLLALCWSAKLSRMRSAHSIPFSARHKGNFLTLPQLSKELWLQLSLFDHNSFITVFLWLGTLVSEYFILLPHDMSIPKCAETEWDFRQTLPSPNRGHMILKAMRMCGEHISLSPLRSCRWHPGILNSAQVPELLQPACSPALLNPWISVCSEAARRFLVCP